MATSNSRDGSRSHVSKTFSMVKKHNQPPNDQNGWLAETFDLLMSPAYKSLSANALRAYSRLKAEHIYHARTRNGELIVTHPQFIEYGVTSDYVADALDELTFKGLIKVRRGRAGDGTAHPSIYTLTIAGTSDGLPATNDWIKITPEQCTQWSEVVRKMRAEARASVGRKRKSSLGNSQARPLGNSQARRAS